MKRTSKEREKLENKSLHQKLFAAPDQQPPDHDINQRDEVLGDVRIRNVYNFRTWWNAILAESSDNFERRASLYQRALSYLPGSYKLWQNFLNESRQYVEQFDLVSQQAYFQIVIDLHERALIYMQKMPRIWLDYAQFMQKSGLVTRTRKVYDRALQSLPVTQHDLIWKQYLQWALQLADDLPQLACHVYKRFIKVKPECTFDYIEFLLKHDLLEEALENYVLLLDTNQFVTLTNKKTRFQLWMELCEFIAKYPLRVQKLPHKPDLLIRNALSLYTDASGKLWVFLADYYSRMGLFDQARETYEEALAQLQSVRDFGTIFNAYIKFEEAMLEIEDESSDSDSDSEEDSEAEELAEQIDMLLNFTFKNIQKSEDQPKQEDKQSQKTDKSEAIQIVKLSKEEKEEMKFVQMENLIQRRPFLLSNVILRQNKHNVSEWLNRIKLCEGDTFLTIKTFTEAIQTVDPDQASNGKLSKIWIRFAHFYETYDELANANHLFHKASQLEFKNKDEMGHLVCSWAEMHLRHNNIDSALEIMRHTCNLPRKSNKKGTLKGAGSLAQSIRAWSFYLDLLENFGTFEDTKWAYQRMVDTKLATPEIILNYASLLQQNNYFDESFRVYEKAVKLFKWPQVYDLWVSYLTAAIKRYGGSKVERIRHLIKSVLQECPNEKSKLFLLIQADFEENFGLISHAMETYDLATKEVSTNEEDLVALFNIHLEKATQFYGVSRTRDIYQRALERIQPGQNLVKFGLRFAKMERKLNEIERARSIYTHLSQYCNPAQYEASFWTIWEQFEVQNGNADTYEDYLRVKRTVQLRYVVVDPIQLAKVEGSQIRETDQEMIGEPPNSTDKENSNNQEPNNGDSGGMANNQSAVVSSTA